MGLVNGITPSSQIPHPVLPIPPLPLPQEARLFLILNSFFSFGILNFLIKFKIILNFRSVKAIIELLGHIKKAPHLPGEFFGGKALQGLLLVRQEQKEWPENMSPGFVEQDKVQLNSVRRNFVRLAPGWDL